MNAFLNVEMFVLAKTFLLYWNFCYFGKNIIMHVLKFCMYKYPRCKWDIYIREIGTFYRRVLAISGFYIDVPPYDPNRFKKIRPFSPACCSCRRFLVQYINAHWDIEISYLCYTKLHENIHKLLCLATSCSSWMSDC